MRHFNKDEWEAYSNSLIDKNTANRMDEHLLICDACLKTYLSITEKTSFKADAVINSPEFTDRVMNKIKKIDKQSSSKRICKNIRKEIIYYCAAACLTLFFTFNGVFQYIFDSVPYAANSIASLSQTTQKVFMNGWSERLTNKTEGVLK